VAEVELINGDITTLEVDAIVNAANSGLRGGGGVDGAIHRAGGPSINEECRKIIKEIGSLPAGEAVITGAGELPARHVIHTVGPVYDPEKPGEMRKLLWNCYHSSLSVALENGLETVAFPNISTGVYGFPKDKAARIATEAVNEFLEENDGIRKILYVCFDSENFELYRKYVS
jgi:O-acetyl-ADP-ribose deacetylase (regulator of RNase III)